MTFLKRLIVLAVVVIVGVTTRLVVRYGVDGALDLLLNAAHAQPTESDVPGAAKPRSHRPATNHPAAQAGAQPALTPAAPIGAGPINAARKSAAAENAQLAAQTGQPVPAASGAAPNQPSSQAAANAAPVIQQGAPKTVATKMDSANPGAVKGAAKGVAATPSPNAKGAPGTASKSGSAPAPAGALAATAGKPVAGAAAAATTTAAPAAPNAKAAPATAPAEGASDSARTSVVRETFEYQRDGRRDPFVSLMMTSDLRPTLSDLTLKGVLYDPSGRRPIAILRDQAGGQWRVTTGMTLGRMRVAQIKPRAVIFTIEEFGFSRQDSLLLGDTTRVRSR